jgi:hypothetical protein
MPLSEVRGRGKGKEENGWLQGGQDGGKEEGCGKV